MKTSSSFLKAGDQVSCFPMTFGGGVGCVE